MGFDPATLGMQAAGNAIDTIFGLALEGHNDARQLRQQGKLQAQQIAGQKEMTDYNYQKQLEMWAATNYPAQVEQMQKAGLNPALMYQKGGPGGMTNLTPGNVEGGKAPTGGMEIMNMMMQRAQIDLIKAQAEKTKAEIPQVGAQTELIKANTGNVKADTALKQINTAIAELQRTFDANTLLNRESTTNLQLSKLIEEVKIIENEREISDATKEQKAKIIGETLQGIIKDNANKLTAGDKMKAELEKINQEIETNKPDVQMAKDGANPKAGSFMKWLYMILKAASTIGGAVK